MSQFLPFILFAFVASITPGPTNILVLSSSTHFGWRAALFIVFGACAGAAVIVLAVGLGLGEWIMGLPWLQRLMGWLGVGWISLLAWQMYRSSAAELDPPAHPDPVGAWGGAGLQLVNPKTWIMAVTVISVFAGVDASWSHYGMYALLFFVIAVPCLCTWAALGQGAVLMLKSPQSITRFNRCMAWLLLASAWGGLLV